MIVDYDTAFILVIIIFYYKVLAYIMVYRIII